jgi:hypothetical protein
MITLRVLYITPPVFFRGIKLIPYAPAFFKRIFARIHRRESRWLSRVVNEGAVIFKFPLYILQLRCFAPGEASPGIITSAASANSATSAYSLMLVRVLVIVIERVCLEIFYSWMYS